MAVPAGRQEQCHHGTQPGPQGAHGLPVCGVLGACSLGVGRGHAGPEAAQVSSFLAHVGILRGGQCFVSVGRSGHTARGESGRWPSPPRDSSARPARSCGGACVLCVGGRHRGCYWLRQELSEHELWRRQHLWGHLLWGPGCVCSGGNLASPSPSRVKVSGADHSIPRSRGGPGRQPASPRGSQQCQAGGHAQRAGG